LRDGYGAVSFRFEELRFMRYAVIIEQGETSHGAYVPDLPGCVAVAETKDEVMSLIKDAIEFHLEGIKQEGQAVPVPSSVTEYVEVAA
jgi:predicted RNase H-like HicB family nuclease